MLENSGDTYPLTPEDTAKESSMVEYQGYIKGEWALYEFTIPYLVVPKVYFRWEWNSITGGVEPTTCFSGETIENMGGLNLVMSEARLLLV